MLTIRNIHTFIEFTCIQTYTHKFIHIIYTKNLHTYIHTYMKDMHAYIHTTHTKNMDTYIHVEHALRGNFQVSFNNFVAMKIAGFEAEDKVFAL